MWTSLPDQHSTVNSSQLTHRLLDVPVNVKSDQQTRRHQQVLQDDDHCELPRALAPVDHAASVSIHPPPVHQVLWVSCRSSARLSTRVGKKRRRGREQWLTEKKPLVIYTLFCLCVCVGVVGCYTHMRARAHTAWGRGRSETSAPRADWLTVCSAAAKVTAMPVEDKKPKWNRPHHVRLNHSNVPIWFMRGCKDTKVVVWH